MSKSAHWRFPLALGAIVAISYGNGLSGSFHYDDFHSLVANPHVRTLTNIPSFFVDPGLFSSDADKAMYRPMLLLTYAINYTLGDYEVVGYHIFNTILHFACSLLVWSIARQSGSSPRAAGWAACLFALHPLATESVNYISSRSELLGACFYLASFRLLAASGSQAYLGGAICFVLGLLSKEMVITLPFMVWLQGMWGERSDRVGRARTLWLWLLAAGYMAWQIWNRFLPNSVSQAPRGLAEQLLTQFKASVLYIKLMLVPTALNVEHQFSESAALDGTVILSAVLFFTLAALVWVRVGGNTRFWLLWPLIVLLPATVVPLNVLVNEHRLYLPLAGLAVLVGRMWPHWFAIRLGAALWPVLFVLIGIHTIGRNAVWESELSLWADSAAKSPSMARSHVHLGNAQAASGDARGAEESFRRALEIESTHRAARTNLANLYLEYALKLPAQEPVRPAALQRALTEFEAVLDSDANYREALSGKATTLSQLGRDELAIATYRQLLQQHPHFADGHYNIGLLLYDVGDYAAAAAAFERAASLHPDEDVLNELGNAYTGARQFSKAARSYRAAHELSPSDALYPRNLGEVLIALGGERLAVGDTTGCLQAWQESRSAFERLLRIAPGDTKAMARLQFLAEHMR